jgi:hypothetical protein
MSETSQPIQVLDVFNKQNFHTGVGSEFVKFPKAQSTVTMPNGVKFGDGSFQNSASAGSSLTVREVTGSTVVTEVDTIKVSNSTLVDNGDGSVTITTGGGGGGGSLTVQDNQATVSSVSSITLPNDTLTNNGGGAVTIASPTLAQVMTEGSTASAALNMGSFNINNSGTVTATEFSGPLTGNVTGNVSGNAGTVTNGVYTNTSSTITGTVTATEFLGPLTGNVTGNVSGNAGTVTNGVYTNTSSTITGTVTASGFSGPLTGNVTGDIKTTNSATSASVTGSSTLSLQLSGNTYDTFHYNPTSGSAAITISTIEFASTGTAPRVNSQIVISIKNQSTQTVEIPTTIAVSDQAGGSSTGNFLVNFSSQVDIPNNGYGIITIYYLSSTLFFASASVFS